METKYARDLNSGDQVIRHGAIEEESVDRIVADACGDATTRGAQPSWWARAGRWC